MLTTIIIMSFFCVGIKICQEPNMVLYVFFQAIKNNTPNWMVKPLFDCVYCFSSFYGSIAFWTIQIFEQVKQGNLFQFHWTILIYWIICVISVVYVNGVLYNGLKHER